MSKFRWPLAALIALILLVLLWPQISAWAEEQLGAFVESSESEDDGSAGQPGDDGSATGNPGTGGGSGNSDGSESIPVPADAQLFTVDYVHDGDTLFLIAEENGSVTGFDERIKVRIIGIDTPEVTEPVECYGPEARELLRDFLPEGSTVRAVTDREAQDRYDRWLLYLWDEDGTFVNLAMVELGAGEALRVGQNDYYWDELRSAEQDAADAGLGLWGRC